MNCYVTITPFWPTEQNLHGSFIYDQVAAIVHHGYYDKAFVIFGTRHSAYYEYEAGRIIAQGFHPFQLPGGLFCGIVNFINGVLFRNYLKKIKLPWSEIKVIHCHCAPWGIFGEQLKQLAPQALLILQHHDLDPFGILPGRLSWLPFQRLYRAINARRRMELADINVCISNKCRNNLLAFPTCDPEVRYQPYLRALKAVTHCRPANLKQIIVLINGVDQQLFFPLPRLKHNTFDIGCIANFIPLKRHIVLIKAIELLKESYPTIRLHLLGQGPLKYKYIEYVRQHHLESFIDFPPEVRHDQLNSFFNHLDLFVLPSAFEGLGCVLLEAAACKIPFIACRGQGIECVLSPEEQQKWLVPPDDVKTLAKVIAKQIQYPSQQILNCDTTLKHNISLFLRHLN